MKDKKRKANKKTKLLIIAGAISLGIIVLSVGLGVGLSDNNDTTTKQKDVIRNNYQLIEKGEGDTKEVIVRLNENTTFDKIKTEVEQIKKDLIDKTITELRLPYGTRSEFQTTDSKLDLDKIKNELGIEVQESKVGYVFYPSDDSNETDRTKTYGNENLVEVVLPTSTKVIPNYKFQHNKIKKVNFKDLFNLESLGISAFFDNKIESLDFSNLNSLKTLDTASFQKNSISGTLIIPPKVKDVGLAAFQNNKIEHLDLTNAKSLERFRDSSFMNNNIKELDISILPKLTTMQVQSFYNNNIRKLNLKSNTLTKIGQEVFANNKNEETGKLYDLIPNNYVFPKSLEQFTGSNVFNRDPSITGSKTIFFDNKTYILPDRFGYPTNIYKAEVDLSILKYKVEEKDGQNILTFDNDTTIGDVILRQDLIKAENEKKTIDKYVFPYSNITKFGDGEEFSKTSKRLLGLKKYLGLSEAVDAWVAGTTNP